MISPLRVRLRWLRRRLSRAHWAARLLKLVPPHGRTDEPGLILLQIDGLSRLQFERALLDGRLPFLRKMIRKGEMRMEDFYSGVPSTTPAVQAEIFYGVKGAVPAFQFMSRATGNVLRMYESDASKEVEDELAAGGSYALLKGGHSYSNIYRAGAEGSWYCSQDLDIGFMIRRMHPLKGLVLGLVHGVRILRMLGLAVAEVGLSVVDILRGRIGRGNLVAELKFIPARIFICILVREMIRFRALLDIEAGLRVIHGNFLGYDEHAHRRGPASGFAHWSLKGIDRAIRDIRQASERSGYRNYQLLVYSDHGQELVVPYSKIHGRQVEDVIAELLADGPLGAYPVTSPRAPVMMGSVLNWFRALFGIRPVEQVEDQLDGKIVVTALGPVGHVYFPVKVEGAVLEETAAMFVGRGGIPMVAVRAEDGSEVVVFNRAGRWVLPGNGREILGEGHPFSDEAVVDLERLCRHRDSGDLVIFGWKPSGVPLSFADESGAHGGPGRDETRGVVLVPKGRNAAGKLRGVDLRGMAMEILEVEEEKRG